MTHKVNPESFRIKETKDWKSRWLDSENYSKYLEEDFKIREFIRDNLQEHGIEKIVIERSPGQMKIIIHSSRPGLVIGRKGSGVQELKEKLEKEVLENKEGKLNIEIKEVKNPWVRAKLCGQWMARQIEKRTPYRRVLKQALGNIMDNKEVKGARVEVAGRLNGLEFSRREWLEEGSLPQQTMRADIDYGEAEAHCSYGTIGIKVFINKGETFDEEEEEES